MGTREVWELALVKVTNKANGLGLPNLTAMSHTNFRVVL